MAGMSRHLAPLIDADAKSKYANNRTPEERHALWHDKDGHRRCCTCNEHKELSAFHKDKKGPSGRAYSCVSCALVRSRKHHHRRMKEDPSYVLAKKESYRKSRWGMSVAEYEEKLASQGSKCAICETTEPKGGWHLDHNHTTGAIRKFLCNPCNRGIGYLQDNEEILMKALNYLREHSKEGSSQ